MRLIDADKLIEVIKTQKVDNDAYCFMCIETMAEIVDNQPTAYDIDKVVAEMEKEREITCLNNMGYLKTIWEEVIDIVRKGGVE